MYGLVMGSATETMSNSDYIVPSSRCVDGWGTMISAGFAVFAYSYNFSETEPQSDQVWGMFMAVPNLV